MAIEKSNVENVLPYLSSLLQKKERYVKTCKLFLNTMKDLWLIEDGFPQFTDTIKEVEKEFRATHNSLITSHWNCVD